MRKVAILKSLSGAYRIALSKVQNISVILFTFVFQGDYETFFTVGANMQPGASDSDRRFFAST
jgi:hypothetical protein